MATTTMTTCDKCGQECVNGCVRFQTTTSHWTRQREHVGEDYYEPLELCLTCGGIAVQVLGLKTRQSDEMAVTEQLLSPIELNDTPSLVAVGRHGIEIRR